MSSMNGTAGFVVPDVTYKGGSVAGITVLASDLIDDHRVLLVDAARLAGDSDAARSIRPRCHVGHGWRRKLITACSSAMPPG